LELIVNTAIAGRVVVGEDFMDRYGSSLSAYYQERGVAADVVGYSLSSGVSKAERSAEITLPAAWPLSFDDVLSFWKQTGVQQ